MCINAAACCCGNSKVNLWLEEDAFAGQHQFAIQIHFEGLVFVNDFYRVPFAVIYTVICAVTQIGINIVMYGGAREVILNGDDDLAGTL